MAERGRPAILRVVFHSNKTDLDSWNHRINSQKYKTTIFVNGTKKTVMNPKYKGK